MRDYFFSNLCDAFAHPARIKIFLKLLSDGRSSFRAVSRGHSISPAGVSQHLKKLRDMQLLSCEQIGTRTYYWVNESIDERTMLTIKRLLKVHHALPKMRAKDLYQVLKYRNLDIGGI